MDKPIKKAVGKVAKEIYEHTPEPVKEKVKDFVVEKAKEKIIDTVQDKGHEFTDKLKIGQEKFANKVYDKAGDAKEKAQEALLTAKGKLGKAAEAGQELQKKISSANKEEEDDRKVKGSKHIKHIGDIKTAKDIKGATKIKTAANIKSSNDIKTMGS